MLWNGWHTLLWNEWHTLPRNTHLNELPLRPSCFYKVQLNEYYTERTKNINKLVLHLTYRYGHVVHLKGLNHLFFEDSYPSIKYIRSFNIATKTLNLNFTAPELVLN